MQTDRTTRLVGLDLARFVALAGMVLVHASSDLVLPPLEAAAGGVEVAAPPAAGYLELVQAAATNRARLLFLLLAGIGVALLVRRRGPSTALLARRAAFLLALGVGLALLGWSDLVLVFYAVLFLLAPLLVRLSGRGLLLAAVLLAVPALVATGLDPARDAGVTGVLLVVGEALPLFCVGLAIGRTELDLPAARRRLRLVGAALAGPGLLVLLARGGLDLTEVDGPVELAAATTSTTGLCLLVLAGCLHLGRAGGGRVSSRLALAGGMPLTGYVGHALLFPVLAGAVTLTLGPATAVAIGVLVVHVLFAVRWRRSHRSGPVEAAMRRVSGG